MDIREAWQNFCSSAGNNARWKDTAPAFQQFLEALTAAPQMANVLPADVNLSGENVRDFVSALCKGKYVEVGTLPEMPLAFATALYWVGTGKRAFILTSVPNVVSQMYADVFAFLENELGLVVRPAGKDTKREKKDVYKGDIICADFVEFVRNTALTPEMLTEVPSAAVVCEADISLYDRRLFFFEYEKLAGTAALYRGGRKLRTWHAPPNIVDVKETLNSLAVVSAMTSLTLPRIRKQVTKSYDDVFGKCAAKQPHTPIPGLAYRSLDEKLQALVNDVAKAGGRSLIFFFESRTGSLLYRELSRQKLEYTTLASMKDLFSFVEGSDDQTSTVGVYPGLPVPEYHAVTGTSPRMNIFMAEHFPFEHHHQKIFAFTEKHLNRKHGPYFFLSLEDAVTAGITDNRNMLQKPFSLIEAAEKSFSRARLLRTRAANAILHRVYALRKSYYRDEVPILTTVHPMSAEESGTSSRKGQYRSQLEGECFCGSGKPFKKCHGGKAFNAQDSAKEK